MTYATATTRTTQLARTTRTARSTAMTRAARQPDPAPALRMTALRRKALVARDTVMLMLSDSEVERVASAEATTHLEAGDEYLDIDHLDEGVRQVGSAPTRRGAIIPRWALLERTWHRIIALLVTTGIEEAPST